VRVTEIRLIGYWWSASLIRAVENTPTHNEDVAAWQPKYLEWLRRLPDVRSFVDPSWDDNERNDVVEHLVRGILVNQTRGLSNCRFCDRPNGSAELSDGVYCWPEGLAHYLSEHAVRLPAEFVAHVLSLSQFLDETPTPEFDGYGQRDRDWSQASTSTFQVDGLETWPGRRQRLANQSLDCSVGFRDWGAVGLQRCRNARLEVSEREIRRQVRGVEREL
jgi:hypothetical protein